jgi:hypothetical protein
MNPNDYAGELGILKCGFWNNTDKVWLVNGFCNKADGNFLGEFSIKTIADTGITLGCYV